MSLASVQALLTRNAKACEEARFPECKCHCGGAFHGSAHSQKWIADTAAELHAAQVRERFEQRAALEQMAEQAEAAERQRFGDQLTLL